MDLHQGQDITRNLTVVPHGSPVPQEGVSKATANVRKKNLSANASIRRINSTPLCIKAGNWRQDSPEIARYLASIYSTSLNFWLKLPSSIAFLAFWLSSGNTPPSNLSLEHTLATCIFDLNKVVMLRHVAQYLIEDRL
jgi:hypothetical protein